MNSKEAINKIMKILNLTTQKFYEAKTEQGVQMKMEDELEVGKPIYVVTQEGMIPAPDGVHMLDDGSEIEVEDGMVSKIKMGKTEDAKLEDKKEEESIVDEDMSQVALDFGDVKLKDGSIMRVGGDEPSVGLRVKKVSYDGTLTALQDGEYETEGGKVISVVGGAIQGVQSIADKKKESGKFADYPWDQCMEDQMKQYGDEEIAKKVCGAIKAGNLSEQFTIAKTAQGAVVESPTFDVGEPVEVIGEDGKKEKAPDGEHQVVLKDESGNENKIRFITKDGIITQRENVEEKAMSAEEIAELFSQALSKFEKKIDAIATKQNELEGRFQKFSKEPAGSKIYNQKTINDEISQIDTKFDAFRRMRETLKKN